MLWIMAKSYARCDSLPAAMPTTKAWLRNLWMYGAKERNQGTKVKLKTLDMGKGRGDSIRRGAVLTIHELAWVMRWKCI